MARRLVFTAVAWQDYLHWQGQDRRTLKRISLLVRDTLRDPFTGVGKPEPLRESLSGLWSRRIDAEHRLVYAVERNDLAIIACRYHYE